MNERTINFTLSIRIDHKRTKQEQTEECKQIIIRFFNLLINSPKVFQMMGEFMCYNKKTKEKYANKSMFDCFWNNERWTIWTIQSQIKCKMNI